MLRIYFACQSYAIFANLIRIAVDTASSNFFLVCVLHGRLLLDNKYLFYFSCTSSWVLANLLIVEVVEIWS